jgi:hypothetical protein
MFIETEAMVPCGWTHLAQRHAYALVAREVAKPPRSKSPSREGATAESSVARIGTPPAGGSDAGPSVLVYVHGFNTTPYFVAVNSAVYARDLGPSVVVAVSWPSAPKPTATLSSVFGGGSMLSLFISKGLDQPYAMAFNHMQVGLKGGAFMGLQKGLKRSEKQHRLRVQHPPGCLCRVSKPLPISFNYPPVLFFRVLVTSPNSCVCVCQASVNAFVGTVVDLRRVLDSAADANEDHRQAVRMHWKAHSMGCHLMLGLVERLHWSKEPLRNLFARVRGPRTHRAVGTHMARPNTGAFS